VPAKLKSTIPILLQNILNSVETTEGRSRSNVLKHKKFTYLHFPAVICYGCNFTPFDLVNCRISSLNYIHRIFWCSKLVGLLSTTLHECPPHYANKANCQFQHPQNCNF